MQPLTEKYRPRRLTDLLGQPEAQRTLLSFADEPASKAFLFTGPTGTGKTSAALCLAADLGIPVDRGEFGGLWQIASGEQTGESVRQAVADLRVRPWEGSGWKVLIVNECDRISEAAGFVWLDVLENLPEKSVVVFTSNSPERIPQRLRDRCEHVTFDSSPADVRHGIEELVARVWWEELGSREPPSLEALGLAADADGNLSFRRALQLLEPIIRVGGQMPPRTETRVVVVPPDAHAELKPRAEPQAPPEADRGGRMWLIGGLAVVGVVGALVAATLLAGEPQYDPFDFE